MFLLHLDSGDWSRPAVSLRNEAQHGSDAKDRRGRGERRRSEAARGETALCSTGAAVGTKRADVRQQERRSERKGCHCGQEESTSGGVGVPVRRRRPREP